MPNNCCSVRLREQLRRDTAEQAARGGGHLEQHAEAHVDQLLAGARPADTELDVAITVVEADGRRDGERKAQGRD